VAVALVDTQTHLFEIEDDVGDVFRSRRPLSKTRAARRRSSLRNGRALSEDGGSGAASYKRRPEAALERLQLEAPVAIVKLRNAELGRMRSFQLSSIFFRLLPAAFTESASR